MHVQLRQGRDLHIGIQNIAGDHPRSFHDAVRRDLKFLFVFKFAGKVDAGDRFHVQEILGQDLSPFFGKNVGGRDIDLEGFVGKDLPAETVQLRHRSPDIVGAFPLLIGIEFVPVIKIIQHQGHVVIAVVADLAAHVQKIVAEIPETLNVAAAFQGSLVFIGIVLNDQPGVADAIFFRQILHVRPPDVGVEGADIHIVVPLDIFSFSYGDGRGEIVQVKRGGVDYRIDADIGKKAVGSGVKAAVGLLKIVQVIDDDRSFAMAVFPDDGKLPLICADQMDRAVFIEGNGAGGIIRIGDLKVFPLSAQHKIGGKAQPGYLILFVTHFPNPKPAHDKTVIGQAGRRTDRKEVRPALYRVENVEYLFPEYVIIVRCDDHVFVAGKLKPAIFPQVLFPKGNLHFRQHIVHLLSGAGGKGNGAVPQQQAFRLLIRRLCRKKALIQNVQLQVGISVDDIAPFDQQNSDHQTEEKHCPLHPAEQDPMMRSAI